MSKNEIIITARKITPRRVQGVLTGFRISIPAAFSAYIDPGKKYDVILKPVKEES